MKLVIVESPAKCTTIKKYLGENYNVMASLGHIRDLATNGKGGLGVDVENGFIPSYIISKDKIKTVKELQAAAKEADEVILATDPDREGEAISWHLATVLGLDINKTKRLEFHEITRDSITEALANPRTIDLNVVASQETRRIVDRIIGFKLSTLIYRKIKSRSAGRVQSATLKMIYDHENEIKAFVSEEYWNILVKAIIVNKDVALTFSGKNGKSLEIRNKEQADKILVEIPEKLRISKVNKEIRTKESKEPFTTSTLQQEAFARLKFKTSKTQSIAQQLYEGINVGDEHVGLITYMRTDVPILSQTYIAKATSYIEETYGKDYVNKSRRFKVNENSQGAHEAIRPTSNHRTPDSIRKYLTPDQYNLYKLIYNRAIASLMKPKKEEFLVVELEGNGYNFKFELSHTLFQGYEIILKDLDQKKDYTGTFPQLNVGDEISVSKKENEQKFTQAPAHYSEAKIVKLMEEVGIGRPSTYASTIDIIKKRKYVNDNGGVLTITDQGNLTAHVLEKYFPDIVNVKYTAQMEAKLDNVEAGDQSRKGMLDEFYGPFMETVKSATELMYKEPNEETGRYCPKCGAPLVYKEGKNGKFVGCSNYPECKYVEKEPKKEAVQTGEICPICGKPLVERKGKKGKTFVACSGYPKCSYIKPTEEPKKEPVVVSDRVCPTCGAPLVKKKGKYGYFYGCSNYPKCNYMEKLRKSKGK